MSTEVERPKAATSVDEWAVLGSNQRPPACKAGALPAELTARSSQFAIRCVVTRGPRARRTSACSAGARRSACSSLGTPSRSRGVGRRGGPAPRDRQPRAGREDAPSGIRTRATTLKGWRPRPLVDGGPSRARIALDAGYTRRRGPLAQLVEQGTFNPKVVGSSPTRPTLKRSPSATQLRRSALRADRKIAAIPESIAARPLHSTGQAR
jgi:hypothetical protein